MDQSLTHRIRERAYEIWAAGGCRDGEAESHWLAAEREILAASVTAAAAPRAAARKSARSPSGDARGRRVRLAG